MVQSRETVKATATLEGQYVKLWEMLRSKKISTQQMFELGLILVARENGLNVSYTPAQFEIGE